MAWFNHIKSPWKQIIFHSQLLVYRKKPWCFHEIPTIFPYMFVGCNSILLTVFPQFLLVKSPVFTYLLWVFPTQSHPSQLPGFADGFAESPSHQLRLRRRSSSLPRIKAVPNLKLLGQPRSAIWLLRFYRFVGGISWDWGKTINNYSFRHLTKLVYW